MSVRGLRLTPSNIILPSGLATFRNAAANGKNLRGICLLYTSAGRGMSSLTISVVAAPFLVPSLSSDRRRLFVISRPPG